jgi:hypothetical protein
MIPISRIFCERACQFSNSTNSTHKKSVSVSVCVCEPFFGWVSEVGGLSGVLSVCLCLERLEAL